MMTMRLLLALLVPWLLGVVGVRWAWKDGTPGVWAAVLGYGYFMGILVTALVMLAMDHLGLRLDFAIILSILVALSAGLAWWTRQRGGYGLSARWPGKDGFWPTWRRAATGLLLLLLLVHFIGLALEVVWRPLYPWDAWMNWAPKARVWLEQGRLVPFVAAEEWLASSDSQVYTLGAWRYPPLVPLIQLWMALALGEWDESLVNLPWLGCGLAMALACYGQIRALGASRLFALVLTYVLASLPYLGTHIALAGYAEIWMAGFYALAVMAFVRWALHRDGRQGGIALVMALALPFIKNPGIIWAATFIPALILVLIPGRRWPLAAVGIGAILLYFYFTTGIHVPLPRIGEILISAREIRLPGYVGPGLTYFPVWDAFGDNGLLLANWHLFWYIAPWPLLVAVPFALRDRRLGSLLVLVVAGLSFLFFIFFFNPQYSLWAKDYTTLNRAFLHLVPALLFVEAVLLLRVLDIKKTVLEREGSGGDHPSGEGQGDASQREARN